MGNEPVPSTPGRHEGKLLKVLGLAFGVSVTVGGCIGVGILKQPGTVAEHLPHIGFYLAAWFLGGVYVLLGALSVAELAAMTPRSGGLYVYVRRALGPYAGFVTGWGSWVGMCAGGAFIWLILARYVTSLLPDLVDQEVLLASGTILLFTALHWRSVRVAGRIQDVATVFKGLAFLALILTFVVLARPHPKTAPEPPLPVGMSLLAACVLVFQAILQTYDGWEGAIYFGGEVHDPGRNLPRSLFLGVALVIAIYMAVNLALLAVLPVEHIAGQEMAVASAARHLLGASGGTVVSVLATLSVLVACNAGTLQTPRILYAMSCDGLFFARGAQVNCGGTPTVALLLSTILMVAFLASGTAEWLLSVLAFFLVTNYALLFVSLFALRYREPDAERPYRTWGYPWTTALALLGSLIYLGAAIGTDESGGSRYALLLLAISYPAYAFLRRLQPLSCSGAAHVPLPRRTTPEEVHST